MVFLALGMMAYHRLRKNPGYRILCAMKQWDENVRSDTRFLFQDMDWEEIRSNYLCSDTKVQGTIGISNVNGMRLGLNLTVDGVRSFSQKKMSSRSSLKMLGYELLELQMYGEKEILYIEAPKLKEGGMAIDTGIDWFPELKAPEEQMNIEQWKELLKDVTVSETKKVLEDDDGTRSEGFLVTVPKENLSVLVYLTKNNEIRRIEMGDIILDGVYMSTLEMKKKLSDGSMAEITLTRSFEEERCVKYRIVFKENEVYEVTGSFLWELDKEEECFSCTLRGLKVQKEGEVFFSGSFKGSAKRTEELKSVLEGREEELQDFESIDLEKVIEMFEEKVYGT